MNDFEEYKRIFLLRKERRNFPSNKEKQWINELIKRGELSQHNEEVLLKRYPMKYSRIEDKYLSNEKCHHLMVAQASGVICIKCGKSYCL